MYSNNVASVRELGQLHLTTFTPRPVCSSLVRFFVRVGCVAVSAPSLSRSGRCSGLLRLGNKYRITSQQRIQCWPMPVACWCCWRALRLRRCILECCRSWTMPLAGRRCCCSTSSSSSSSSSAVGPSIFSRIRRPGAYADDHCIICSCEWSRLQVVLYISSFIIISGNYLLQLMP